MKSSEIFKMIFGKKKIFSISLIIVTLIICVFFSLENKKVDAQVVPVLDGPNLAQNTLVAANTTSLAQKELVLDGIATQAAKVVISNLTNSIVTWINSGFQGSPAFVTNPGAYFTDVADQIAGNFIAGTELGFVCEPFSLDIRIALALGYSSTFTQKNFCRLSDAVRNTENFARFTNGDFSQGGWNSWFEISQNSQNNPLGAYIASTNELTIRTARGQALSLNQLNWGRGFLSYRECIAEDEQTGDCAEYGDIQTPGSVIESQLEGTLGTGIRQLEIADEINEIVGALVGQLVQTVLNEGLSSFGSGGSNYSSLGTSQSNELNASCSVSRTRVLVGEPVTWSTYVYGGSGNTTTYEWRSDDEALNGATTPTVTVIYTEPGIKTASVNINRGGQNLFRYCSSRVTVE